MNEAAYFEGIRQLKLMAKKEVGQNFLVDPEIAGKIVDLLDPAEGKVLEIGSGAGSLTYFLSERGFEGTAIDIDPGLVSKLQNDFEKNPKIDIEQRNVLKTDLSTYSQIIGNLPYYITSKILEKVLLDAKICAKVAFMIQKEAFDRIMAKPGTKDYGPLGILMSLEGAAKKEFVVPSSAFVPAPHIESIVFSYTFSKDRNLDEAASFYRFLNKLFLNRRKTVYNNLKGLTGDAKKAEQALVESGISLEERAENIAPATLLGLFRRLD